MALIPPIYFDCVVAIGTNLKGKQHWIGTGFLFGDLIEKTQDESNIYSVYLVTNKHVLENLDSIYIRFNPQNNQSAKDYDIILKTKNGSRLWVGHPDPEIDVAVLPININNARAEGMKCDFFQSDKHVNNISDLITNEASEGDNIYIMGFPLGIVDTYRQHVFVRSGVISRIKDLFEKRSKDFVVDAFVFPGNSGGPVITKPELQSIQGTKSTNSSCLIGIVKGYIPYTDIAISQQSNRPRVSFEENSGLTKIEPVDHILETIEHAKKNATTR